MAGGRSGFGRVKWAIGAALLFFGCSAAPGKIEGTTNNDGVPEFFEIFGFDLVLDSAIEPPAFRPAQTSVCAVPVRGGMVDTQLLEPGHELSYRLLGPGGRTLEEKFNERALAEIKEITETGVYFLELLDGAGKRLARVPIEYWGGRMVISGVYDPLLRSDVAGRSAFSPIMRIEALVDSDWDLRSDTGWHLLAEIASEGGGVIYRHLGDRTSERARLSSDFEETETSWFNDRDGDFLEDAVDPDHDGDGKLDSEESEAMACPGFSHDDLAKEGAKHQDLECIVCHVSDDEAPRQCEDCHTLAGKDPLSNPVALTPEGHFQTGCQHCHLVDQAFADFPAESGTLHEPFPLLGKHLETKCFTCHETGDPKPEQDCAGCHAPPPNHYGNECQACHTSENWDASGEVNHHTIDMNALPLTFAHAPLKCDACHGAAGFEGLDPDCASCHAESTHRPNTLPRTARVAISRASSTRPSSRSRTFSILSQDFIKGPVVRTVMEPMWRMLAFDEAVTREPMCGLSSTPHAAHRSRRADMRLLPQPRGMDSGGGRQSPRTSRGAAVDLCPSDTRLCSVSCARCTHTPLVAACASCHAGSEPARSCHRHLRDMPCFRQMERPNLPAPQSHPSPFWSAFRASVQHVSRRTMPPIWSLTCKAQIRRARTAMPFRATTFL